MFVKLTYLLFYRHIFHPTHPTIFFVNAGIALMLVAYLSMSVATFAQCHPVEYTWDKSMKGGRCFRPSRLAFTTGAFNVFSDIYILLVPIPAVMSLPLGTTRKLRVIGIFGLGILCVFHPVQRQPWLILQIVLVPQVSCGLL